MALTIRDISEEELDRFRALTGQKTATKALVTAAQIGISATADLERAEETIKTLQTQLTTYRQTLQQLSPLCQKVIELGAQRDLFEEKE